jgi:hypothetical protein
MMQLSNRVNHFRAMVCGVFPEVLKVHHRVQLQEVDSPAFSYCLRGSTTTAEWPGNQNNQALNHLYYD